MANTLTHFTCHIHTGAHSVGNYIDETPMASFSFPQVSSLCSGWANRVLAQEDENSRWRKDWLLFELQCTFLLAFFNPPHVWVGHQRWGSEFLSFWVWVWSREGLPQRPASLVGVIFLLSPNLPGTPRLGWGLECGEGAETSIKAPLWPGLALPWQQI